MICYEGKLSLYCFIGTFSLICILLMPQIYFQIVPNHSTAILFGPLFYFVLINMFIRMFLKGNNYQIAIRAAFLGFILFLSFMIFLFCPIKWKCFGLYGITLTIFHYSEFLTIAFSNPATLSKDSFLLNHSIQYGLAAFMSWCEFLIEAIFFPDMKGYVIFWVIGAILCVIGEILRKLAILTAKTSFNHLVQHKKKTDHILITHGIYSYMRHPSYVGWFWWSIGTQIILFNPICIVLFTLISWKFFYNRIQIEEVFLLNFFGNSYYDYQQKVSTGLPFIKGYILEAQQ